MKKIFRMALVLALSGAALLYTGCTKDYSEDINTLDKRLTDVETVQLKTIKDQIAALQQAKLDLEAADQKLQGLIDGLRTDLTKLQNTVTTLSEKHDKDVAEINGKINKINGDISDLQQEDIAIKARIKILEDEIVKKADKTYVDDQIAALKDVYATITWVKQIETDLGKVEGRVTIAENDIKDLKNALGAWDVEEDGTVKEAIDEINTNLDKAIKDIDQLKKDVVKAQQTADHAVSETEAIWKALELYYTKAQVDELLKGLREYVDAQDGALDEKIDSLAGVKLDIAKYQKDSAVIAKKVGEIDELLGETITAMTLGFQKGNERIDSVITVMNQYKKDLEEAFAAADDVVRGEFAAADKAIKEAYEKADSEIETAYKKADTELWTALNRLDNTLTAAINAEVSRAKKAEEDLDKDIKNLGTELRAEDARIEREYKQADTEIKGLISALESKVDNLAAELRSEISAIKGRLDVAEATIDLLFNRIQSIVYVPEYNDGKITVNSILLSQAEQMKAEGDEEEEVEEIDWLEDNLFIPAPSHVKYRVYGEDSKGIRDAIVAKFKEGNNVLSFDVVRVLTRVNKNGAEIEILDVNKDDMMEDVLDITIRAMHFGDAFYWTAYKGNVNVNYPGFIPLYNAEFSRIGDLEDAPSFSMSLVVTDETESKLVCSCYNNIIPAVAGEVGTSIVVPDPEDPTKIIDITGVEYGEYIKIPYNDTKAREILADARVNFNVDGEDFTYDEMIANGYAVPEIKWEASATPDFTNSVAAATHMELPDPYFVNVTAEFPATAALAVVNPGGVRSLDNFTYTYTIKNLVLNAYSQVEVTAVPATVNTTIDDIVWTYTLDAAVDAARFNEAQTGIDYTRGTINDASAVSDGVVVNVNADDAAALQALGFTAKDFKKLTPKAGSIKVTAKKVVDAVPGDNDETVAAALVIVPDVTADGDVVAYLKGFEFDYAYTYEAVFELPNATNPSVTCTVKGAFNTINRPGDVQITLPAETVPFEVNLAKKVASDPYATLDPSAIVPANGLSELANVDDFIDAINNAASAYVNSLKQAPATDFIDPANETKIEFATPADPKAVIFDSWYDVNVPAFDGETIGNEFVIKTVATLWYGKKVTVIKSFTLDVDGIYDFERIPEYVNYFSNGFDCYTSVQPWWTPDGATTDVTIPVENYDVNTVKLNQHFRVVKYVNDQPKPVVVTSLEGELPADEPIEREFWLEVPGADNKLADASHVDDPRPEAGVEGSKRPARAVGIDLNNGQEIDNILSYYSKQDQIDVIGRLFAVNSNDETSNRIELTTKFNRVPAVGEDYSNYVVKKYDPITKFVILANNNSVDNPIEIPVNNSITTRTTIYNFLSLKDMRGYELIDSKNGTWLAGNNENGFATGKTTDAIYGLEFASTCTCLTEGISPETMNRVQFDTATGLLTYNNELQTQLQKEIVWKLGVNVEYPWGTRTATVYVKFINAPIAHLED